MNEFFIMVNTLRIYLGAVTLNKVNLEDSTDPDYHKIMRLDELRSSLESSIEDLIVLINLDETKDGNKHGK